MASFSKTGKGWRTQIKVLGVRDSCVFSTRCEAVLWAALRERDIRKPPAPHHRERVIEPPRFSRRLFVSSKPA